MARQMGHTQSNRLQAVKLSMLFVTFHNFLVASLAPNPQDSEPPLNWLSVTAFIIFAAVLFIWRLSPHPQPENTPFCSDKSPTSHGLKQEFLGRTYEAYFPTNISIYNMVRLARTVNY
jgi:hypothetical protein